MKDRLVVVDVETTGVDATKASLVSIGAVRLNEPQDTFYGECNVWPGATIDDRALEVNGMKYADIKGNPKKDSEAKLIADFLDWLPDSPMMIAHNASFDRDFVAAAAKRAGVVSPFGIRTVDIHSVVLMHLLRVKATIPKRLSLNVCLKALGLPPEPDPHNALTGARCEAELFLKIMDYDGDEQPGLL